MRAGAQSVTWRRATIHRLMKIPTTHVLALREAALLLGGERKLAEFLDITEWLVCRWLEGLGHPPDFILALCRDRIESGKEVVAVAAQPGLQPAPSVNPY